MRKNLGRLFITAFLIFAFHIVISQKLAVVPYITGLAHPIDLKHCGDDRVFVVDQIGSIRIIDGNGNLLPTPFLDISSKISSFVSEEGLLGLAFSPNYKTDRKFYVFYTANILGQLSAVVEEYKVSIADSNVADLSSALTLFTQTLLTKDHHAGNLMFGKDGYLYVNIGFVNIQSNSQDKTILPGKILRLDISNSSIAQPYAIPTTNPFYNDATPGIKKEIWAYGLRNPWRSSFDKITGDLWIADAGQLKIEEVDFESANDAGGHNYGWNITEGDSCYLSFPCDKTGITVPIYQYFHNGAGSVIIGGYVSRTAQSKSLFGKYIFADYINQFIDGFDKDSIGKPNEVKRLIASTSSIGSMISLGEDRDGDLYIMFGNVGTLYKLEDTSYLRRPKAYMTPVDQGNGSYLLQGLPGKNLTYQWLLNNSAIPGATSPDYLASASGIYSLKVTNTLTFSDTSVVFSLGVLPVSLTSFIAQKIARGKVLLQWQTAFEQNISSYSILRKQNNEVAFTNIGSVLSKSLNGNSASKVNYNFTDSTASRNGKIYYRLQIKNIDGSLSYSDIRLINSRPGKNNFYFYPNPAKGSVEINLDEFNKPVVMRLYNNTAQKIKEQLLSQQSTSVNLTGLKGIFILQLTDKDGGNMIRKKLVVE